MPCLYLSSFALFFIWPEQSTIFSRAACCCDFKKISLYVKNLSSISFSRRASCPPDSIRRGVNFLEKNERMREQQKRDEGLRAPNWHIAVIYPRLVICRSAMANGATTIKVAQFDIPSCAKRRFTRGRRRRRAERKIDYIKCRISLWHSQKNYMETLQPLLCDRYILFTNKKFITWKNSLRTNLFRNPYSCGIKNVWYLFYLLPLFFFRYIVYMSQYVKSNYLILFN